LDVVENGPSPKSPKLQIAASASKDTLGDKDQEATSLESGDSVEEDSSKPTAGIVNDKATPNDEAVTTPNEASELDSDQNRPTSASEEGNDPPPEPTMDVSKPVKRARSAYFIFADEKRPQIQKQVL
jgi:hypothetical protein